jgi:Dyp-type peroxidase family
MPISVTDLAVPIDSTAAKFQPMLSDLQANILKGHGRPATRKLFLKVKTGKAAACRAGLKALATLITSAKQQLDDTATFKASGIPGGVVTLAFLSKAGYSALGAKPARVPTDPAFAKGMGSASRKAILSDPPRTEWHKGYVKVPDAMILIADTSQELCIAHEALVLGKLGSGWTVVHTEKGQAILNGDGNGIEHFGYVDGRSQPLMLTDEIAGEGDISKWDPSMGPGQIALLPDPAGKTSDSFGSYLVYRKLEQDVAAFKVAEHQLSSAQAHAAAAAGVTPLPPGELAGAMMIGRFENGTAVILNDDEVPPPVPNNFNYSADPSGTKCPRHAHIRKTNPRDGSERDSIMPRRGIPFGDEEGSGGERGLLFMAYNNRIPDQYEFIQQSWANNVDFPFGGVVHGVDPIIGQGPSRRPVYTNCPIAHGDLRHHNQDFQQFVTMRGGEYFFAPSISGLSNLA